MCERLVGRSFHTVFVSLELERDILQIYSRQVRRILLIVEKIYYPRQCKHCVLYPRTVSCIMSRERRIERQEGTIDLYVCRICEEIR
jgi:hypothetical protein